MASSSGSPVHIDLRGEVCPYTFVRTKLVLEKLPIGATVTVVIDHPPARENLPRSAREWGQKVDSVVETEPGVWAISLTVLRH